MVSLSPDEQPVIPSDRSGRRARESLRIERAGLMLFLERDSTEVSVEEIAEAAGISRRTFFRYFPSRDDLIIAAHTRAMSRNLSAFRDRPANESLTESLIGALRSVAVPVEEMENARLSKEVLKRFSRAFERASFRATRTADDLYVETVAFRLRQVGQDDANASAIAAALSKLGSHCYLQWLAAGSKGPFIDRFQRVLKATSVALA